MIRSSNPFLTCGKVFNVNLPKDLINNKPITLAKVKINTGKLDSPYILLNYSSNIETSVFISNPNLSVVYRLVRKNNETGQKTVLEEWNLSAAEIIPTGVTKNTTIEPLVLNYCECLMDQCGKSFTYILQLTDIILNNTTLKITKQEFSAIVSPGAVE